MEDSVMSKLVAVLTPTYNRAYILTKLYESLLKQTNFDFVWYIIDDGSSDNTKELVSTFDTDKFKIVYKYKTNGGKHTALNCGMGLIQEPLTFIVDSDDWLTEDAVETICKDYELIKDKKEVGILSYLKMFADSKIVGKLYSKDYLIDTYIGERVNRNITGDKAEIFKTEVLKEYPFPEFQGERFLSEAVVWVRIAKKYKSLFINKGIYYCEYLQDGLSNSVHKTLCKNPEGAVEYYKELAKKPTKLIYRIKYNLAYDIYAMIDGRKIKNIIKYASSKFWAFVLLLPAKIMSNKKKKEFLK